MGRLAANPMCIPGGQGLLLKDPTLNSSADYDIGVVARDACAALIEILFKSAGLFGAIAAAVGDSAHQCIDETDDRVTLNEVFRMRGRGA
jgi:hypothetical protein